MLLLRPALRTRLILIVILVALSTGSWIAMQRMAHSQKVNKLSTGKRETAIMIPILTSKKFGELHLMEDTEYPVYCGDLSDKSGKLISFSVHCPDSPENDGVRLLESVELRVEWLLANEPAARLSIADAAVKTLKAYWGDSKVPSGADFTPTLTLSTFNCFPKGFYECWYTTEEPLANWDLTGEFDEELKVSGVNFDG